MASDFWTALDLTDVFVSRPARCIYSVRGSCTFAHSLVAAPLPNKHPVPVVCVRAWPASPSHSCPHAYIALTWYFRSHFRNIEALLRSVASSRPLCEACHRVHQPFADAHAAMSAGLVHRPCVMAMTMAHQLFPSPEDQQFQCIL